MRRSVKGIMHLHFVREYKKNIYIQKMICSLHVCATCGSVISVVIPAPICELSVSSSFYIYSRIRTFLLCKNGIIPSLPLVLRFSGQISLLCGLLRSASERPVKMLPAA